MRKRLSIWVLLMLAAVAVCTSPDLLPTATSIPYQVTFDVSRISVEPSGKARIELAVANTGTQELPADKFAAHFALSHADGTLRSTSDTILPCIPPSTGDLTTVVNINAPLKAGEYHVSWGASGLGSTLVTFEIVAWNGGLQIGKQSVAHFGPGHPYPGGSLGQ
jgi:hypothetical protein